MLLPDETYEQAICLASASILPQTTKKIIEFFTSASSTKATTAQKSSPSSIVSLVTVKEKLKATTNNNKSIPKTNLQKTDTKNGHAEATPAPIKATALLTEENPIRSDDRRVVVAATMNNYYNNQNLTTSSSASSPTISGLSSSSLFGYADIMAATSGQKSKKIATQSDCGLIDSENTEVLQKQEKRRSSIASYDRTSDFFNHIPDFEGEALSPFSLKNIQQQEQQQQQQNAYQHQKTVKFSGSSKCNKDNDAKLHSKNGSHDRYHQHQTHHQYRNTRRHTNAATKVTILRESLDPSVINGNRHEQHQRTINNSVADNNNNNDSSNESSSSDDSNSNINFNLNNNINIGNMDSFNSSSDILKICEEFLWRYRIRPDFFCKYHKALSNSTQSSPKSRTLTKVSQKPNDLLQSSKYQQQSQMLSQHQQSQMLSQQQQCPRKLIQNARVSSTNLTPALRSEQKSHDEVDVAALQDKKMSHQLSTNQLTTSSPAAHQSHPVKMKRFRKATAIYTLPTRPTRKAGSISSSTDASSSNEAVHLQQRLKSLSTELVTLRNRLHVGQTGNNNNNTTNSVNSTTTTANPNVGSGGGGGGSNCINPTTATLNGLSLSNSAANGSLHQSNYNGTGSATTTSANCISQGGKSQSSLNIINQINSNSGNNQAATITGTISSDTSGGVIANSSAAGTNIRNSNISSNKTYPLSIPPGAGNSTGSGANSAIISSRNTSIPLPLPHHVVGSLDNRCETLPRRSVGILSDLSGATTGGTTTTNGTTSGTLSAAERHHTKSYDTISSHHNATKQSLSFDYVNGNTTNAQSYHGNGPNSNGGGGGGGNNGNGINQLNTINTCNGSINIITATSKTIDNGKRKKPTEMDDLIHLTGPLTEDAVMRTLQSRFNNNQYFTNVGPILLSINPYNDVGNPLTLSSTRSLPLAAQLRRIVQEAVRQQAETGYPQAIILSGTSGAGKTHCSMLLLRQLFAVAGGGPETDAFKHLAAAFTVLRSLGSAKTTTNSESSRIGQFIEVQVTDGALYRTKIHCYFLDQTRVVRPLPNEKNYHIFYQMLAGLSREERIKLNLEGYTPANLRYLQYGDTQQNDADDASRFQAWKTCLGILGIPFLDVVRVLAAVLLLGNVQFVDGQGIEVDVKGEAELNSVAGLLGVPPAALFRGLTTRTHNARGQLVKSVCDANMSNMTRDCLAKALYCRTVATIVRRANSLKRLGSTLGTLSSDSNESVHNQGDVASQHASTIGGNSGSKSMAALNNAVRHATDGFIGILDMFGFEEQSPAQLEHLCINLCAETMQHFYNTHIFKSSVESCRDEGILCDTEVDYVDNVPCIDLISSLRTGLLSMLDAECSVRGTAESYVAKIKVQHRNSTRLETKHTELHDPRMFIIRHFAGKVEYDATEFLDTNRDVVPDDLVAVFYKHTCNFGFATHLFGSELKALYAMENVPRGLSFRIAPTSHTDLLNGDEPVSTLTQDFHTRLDNLLRTLVHARPHFVRCIRSNSNEISGHFERVTVVKQIRSLQVLETVNLMASGFPHRMRFKQFTARYKLLAPFRLLRRSEEKALEDCDLILQYAMENLPEIDGSVTLAWAPGKRHVFLSEGIRQHLENLRSDVRTKSATLIQSTWRGWQLRKRIGTIRRPREIIMNSSKLKTSTPNAAPRISSTTGTTTRPRPQPIAGTPPPDPNEKCDSKIIQQTCTLFGLDLERPPPVPPSRPYTVTGNSKLGYPQTRIMKMNFPEDSITNPPVDQLKKGETVTVVGASHCRGHLIVEHKGQSFHVPFQYMSSPWKISKCIEN